LSAFETLQHYHQEIVNGNLKGMHIWDGAGRVWRGPRKDIRQLKADIEKYVEKPD
jgi:hypothetical protein